MKNSVCGVLALAFLLLGCQDSYRVGDFVLVEWCEGEYPAYVLDRKGRTRYRVHFDGYETRWDAEVPFDRIKSRLTEPPQTPPPLCDRVAQAMGLKKQETKGAVSPYKVGARVKVSWQGSVYKATIIEVVDAERFKVHYDGHETAWDEVIGAERVVAGTQ
ncbi:MAG: hypothetical protein RJA70_1820 [Pseudomonadota bacterium]